MAKPVRRGKRWGVQFSHAGVRYSATFPTATECNDWQIRKRLELQAEGAGRAGDVHSLNEALRRYAREVSPKHKGERWEVVRIERMARELPITLPLSQVKPDHVIAWRDARLRTVSAASVTRELNLLSSIFNSAIREWRWIKSNPVSEVSRPPAAPHRERIITRSEVRRMLRALGYRPRGEIVGERKIVGAVFVFALRTGMRSSEITGLRWRNVHDSWVRLPDTKNGTRRDVPLSRSARRLIQRMRGTDHDHVFPVSAGSRDAIFRAARDRAGLDGFHFHDARHCFATRIGATVGQPGRLSFPEFVRVMGWRDPRFAMVYVNPSAEDLARKL